MLVARELRRAGYRGRLGFYLHVPFPAIDIFETMPWAAEVMSALLDYDRIGLQTQRYAENFVATARGLLGADAETRAKERVRAIPVGIDPDRFAESRGTAPDGETLGVEAMLGGRKLILGVDRLDYSKGIPERLEAFARLLERFPEWRNQVSFVQVSVPTRSEVPEYAELRGARRGAGRPHQRHVRRGRLGAGPLPLSHRTIRRRSRGSIARPRSAW